LRQNSKPLNGIVRLCNSNFISFSIACSYICTREVYNDALAPPQPTRRAKPWERVPVPAHALRLHGQKIWKKAGINTQPTNSKAADEAQAELEREGMGARKRSRHMGGKEDISNAKWSQSSALNDENRMAIPEILSPIKKDSLALDLDALVVPRKRTNANHLITPRKASKKIPLQDLTQIPAIATKLEDGPLLKQLDATSNNPQSRRRQILLEGLNLCVGAPQDCRKVKIWEWDLDYL